MPQKRLGRLETSFHEPYEAWKANPSLETSDAMLKAVRPIIDKAVRTFGGPSAGPSLYGKAKLMALDAFRTYDPQQAQLNTHLFSQLQGLRRAEAHSARAIAVPDQVAIDRARLDEAMNELQDDLGREPSDVELSDYTGLSRKRIGYVRGYQPATSEGKLLQTSQTGQLISPAVESTDNRGQAAWTELVYHDLGDTDRLIVEHTLGLHGKPVMDNRRLANVLKISPAAVSQRKAKIQALLDSRDEFGLL